MKAVLYTEPGGVEVLKYQEVDDPVPERGDVVVEVAATSLNRLDVLQRNGWFQIQFWRPVRARLTSEHSVDTKLPFSERVSILSKRNS